jgi:hypothetical protein
MDRPKSNTSNLLLIIGIVIFICICIWTFITVFSVTAHNDTLANMTNAMSSIVIVNLVMVACFAGIAFWYVNSYPQMQQPYMMFLLHINILISIIALSISSLYSVSN